MKKTIFLLAIPLLLGGVRGGLFAQDMGATALVAPASPLCAASGQTVTVTIQNFDAADINFSINPTDVVANIAGPIAQSFTLTVNTGTLVASGTMNVDVTAVADFSTAGTYTVSANTVLAGDLNTSNDTMAPVNITVNALPVVALGADVTQCGGTVILDAGNPGSAYLWSTAETTQTITVSITGTYSVVVTDGNGCTGNDAINVSIFSNPPVNLGGDVTVCSYAYLNAGNPGATYSWSTGETIQTIQVFSTGTYYVQVTDINGCTNSDTADVTVNPLPVVNLGSDVTQCGGTVLLDAGNPGATYLWSTLEATQTITVASSGTYFVNVTDTNSCTASDTIIVTISLPVVNLGADVTQCGGTVLLDAGNPGSTYLWSDASTNQTLTVSASGTYYVTVTDVYGCSASDTINITINSLPIVNLGADITQCGGTALLDAGNPGSTYSWSTTATTQTITVSASGTYSVTVTDTNGCSAADSVNVFIDVIGVNLGPDTILCGGTILLDAGNAGATYLWSDNSTNQTLLVSASGQYYVWVTNACGSVTDIINVTIYTPPAVNLGADITQCGSATLDAGNPGLSYLWSTAETTQTISVSASGQYYVIVTDTNNCTASDSVNVTINPYPVVNLGANITNCSGATLDAGNPGSTYLWSTGASTQTISATSSGTYYVTVTSASGCTGSDTVLVSTSGTSTPLVQGFETGNFNQYGWVLNNPDNGSTWARITTVGKTGTVSMWKENFADTSIGQIDEVTTQAVDLSGGTAPPTLTFQLAYQLYSDPSSCTANCSDTLRIQYSTDCGNSWITVYNKYGVALTTDSSAVFSIIPFTPAASQWRMETVSLPAASSVLVKFININGYENNLYIDDININNGVGIAELFNDDVFSVFPNPTSGKFTIQLATGSRWLSGWQLASSQKQVASIEIYNIYGEKVYSSTLNQVQGNNQSAIINLQDFPSGIYLLEILTDNNTKTVKRIILNK